MDARILDCRIRGIESNLRKKAYAKTIEVVKDTLRLFDTVVENDLEDAIESSVVEHLCLAQFDLILGRYEMALVHLRKIQETL